jgi:hypothetical protein
MYLKVSGVSLTEARLEFFDGVFRVVVEKVEIADTLAVEKWAHHLTMESAHAAGQNRISKLRTSIDPLHDVESVSVRL